ncbi:Alpha/Beta hydrolase protein [Aspergillus pseudoustus]|uniref:Alpha/Beta hydrolase protein n=1 Tax=Aspergillus pseudoustus TaxID=1810923 RepID=A0ABR4L1Y1_9EURO
MKMATAIWAVLADFFRCVATCLTPWRHSTDLRDERIQEVIRALEHDRVEDLRHRFLAPLRLLLPQSTLDRGWKIVYKTFGLLEHIGDPVISNGWWISSIKFPLRFQRANFGMLIQMTSGGSLVGLRFLPLHRLGFGEGWQPPAYVNRKIIESDITLGKGKFKLGGTLCLPPTQEQASKSPCIVFIAGSGPCDRHSTVEENQPFADLAWGLACRGIASIRFDKVTHTHPKQFRNQKNISLTDEYVEHVIDALSHAHRHPSILPDKVFLLGHSLGAVVAPKIAMLDSSVAGCILMAGPAEPIYRCLVRQLRYLESLDGPEAPYLGRQIAAAQAQAELADSDLLNSSTPAKKLPFGLGPSYWLDYRKFDPIGIASTLDKPIIVLQGGRDYQVTVKDDYQQWQAALEGKGNVQFRLYQRLNHLFIAGDGPSTPLEYMVPGNVDEEVIRDISTWVLQ